MGGNVFDNTSKIKKENIIPTLTQYFNELSSLFPRLKEKDFFNIFYLNSINGNFITLGSTLKKDYSGDIDLGVDLSNQDINDWNISNDEIQSVYQKLLNRAKTATTKQLMEKAFLICMANYINNNSNLIQVDIKKINYGNMFTCFPQYDLNGRLDTFVQIDWMVGNLDWLEFTYYYQNDVFNSNFKGLWRTQLLVALCDIANLSFSHSQGIKDKLMKKYISNNPKELVNELNKRLNINLSICDTFDFYILNNQLKDNLSVYNYDKLCNTYLSILDKTRTDIPDIFHNIWILKKDELKLTGKFLPKDSYLQELL